MDNNNKTTSGAVSDRRYFQTEDSFIADDLRQMELAPNYNEWLFSLVKPFIGRRILEIGSGIGTMSKKIIQESDLLVGVEPNQYCARQLEKNFGDSPKFVLINKRLEETRYDDLFNKYKFDTVLCMNVLEHIQDDIGTLQFFEQLLEPGGRVVLLLPAFPQVYGPIDKAVGHFRRYTKSSINNALLKTSLVVEKNFYSNFPGLIGWFFNARIKRSTGQSNSQIRLFNSLTPFISLVEKTLGCPIGLSLISISKK